MQISFFDAIITWSVLIGPPWMLTNANAAALYRLKTDSERG